LKRFEDLKPKNLKTHEHLSFEEILKLEGSIAILAKATRDSELEVEFVSREITDLGYDILEAKNKNVTQILPSFYHRGSFFRHIEEIASKDNQFDAQIFVQTRDGHIQLKKLFISPMIIPNNPLKFLLIFTPKSTIHEYLVHNDIGEILYGSQEISAQISMSSLKSGKQKIDSFISNLKDFNQTMKIQSELFGDSTFELKHHPSFPL
jgi:hypothetical protein